MSTNKTIGFLAASVLTSIAVAGPATAELPKSPVLSPTTILSSPIFQQLPKIPLTCMGTGASDVTHRHHSIKNSSGYSIPKGTALFWQSSDKGSGYLKLTADLAPNATADVIQSGQTNGYTCTAYFHPGPADFTIKTLQNNSNAGATITVANLNPWTDAAASVLRFETRECFTYALKGSVDVSVPAIPKGGSVTVTATLKNLGYYEAIANANGAVPEANKANNSQQWGEYNPGCALQ